MPAILYQVCCWRLEPYAGKLACTVLRGRGVGDNLLLPDQREGTRKTPHYIQLAGGEPIGFAGLYDVYKDELLSCTILTTAPNEMMAKIHDRMPVILSAENYTRWLDSSVTKPEEIEDLLQPFAGMMHAHVVSNAVNSPKNNTPDLIAAA